MSQGFLSHKLPSFYCAHSSKTQLNSLSTALKCVISTCSLLLSAGRRNLTRAMPSARLSHLVVPATCTANAVTSASITRCSNTCGKLAVEIFSPKRPTPCCLQACSASCGCAFSSCSACASVRRYAGLSTYTWASIKRTASLAVLVSIDISFSKVPHLTARLLVDYAIAHRAHSPVVFGVEAKGAPEAWLQV